MTAPSVDRTATGAAVLRGCVLGLAGLVVLKFLVLLAEEDWDLARSPFMLLVVVALPVSLIVWLARRRPRAAAAVALPLLVLFLGSVVSALVRDGLLRQAWADYPFAYGGILLAGWGGVAAVRMLRAADTGSSAG